MDVFACMYVCTSRSCNAHRGQERATDQMEIELHVVVSHRVDGGSKTGLSRGALYC